MKKLFFSAREWNRFAWSIQEVLCKKYEVILTDYQTRKEKIISLLNKINIKNFNKGMDVFNKTLDKFSKTVDSLTSNKSGFTQGKSTNETLGKTGFSKDSIWGKSEENIHQVNHWGKPIRLIDSPISIWSEKPSKTESNKPRKDPLESIWGKKEDRDDG